MHLSLPEMLVEDFPLPLGQHLCINRSLSWHSRPQSQVHIGNTADLVHKRLAVLLCLEAMLELKSQLVWLVLHNACGPEARPGLHSECGIIWPLSHGVEVWILHGIIAPLGHLCLRCILLWENRGLLLQHHTGLLTRELLRIHSLALADQFWYPQSSINLFKAIEVPQGQIELV